MNSINQSLWLSRTTILLIVVSILSVSCCKLVIIVVQVINKDVIDKCCVKRTIFNY